MAQDGAELSGDVGEPPGRFGCAGERHVAAAGAERGEHEAGIVAAGDDQLVPGRPAERVEEADAGVARGTRRAPQARRDAEFQGGGQRRLGLGEVVDDDDRDALGRP